MNRQLADPIVIRGGVDPAGRRMVRWSDLKEAEEGAISLLRESDVNVRRGEHLIERLVDHLGDFGEQARPLRMPVTPAVFAHGRLTPACIIASGPSSGAARSNPCTDRRNCPRLASNSSGGISS